VQQHQDSRSCLDAGPSFFGDVDRGQKMYAAPMERSPRPEITGTLRIMYPQPWREPWHPVRMSMRPAAPARTRKIPTPRHPNAAARSARGDPRVVLAGSVNDSSVAGPSGAT